MLISNMSLSFFVLLLLSARLSLSSAQSSSVDGLRTYIIHVDRSAAAALSSVSTFDDVRRWYNTFLPASTASSGGDSRLLYPYKSVLSGFAARFTERELAELEARPGFLSAYPDRIVRLQTTHTAEFLGLRRDGPGLWNDTGFGKGIVIGVLDSGVSPDLPPFGGEGMPPPPAKWKGACEFNASDCNNKLIGARNFVRGLRSMRASATTSVRITADGPYDDEGHGTHTASTAAGAFVDNANVDGQANGTASGMAPFAHLAVYKVCGPQGCAISDVLAGMDAAVEDGVDVMSLSLSGGSHPFYSDPIAIGAFAAIESGIFVSCAAGNAGPAYQTMANEAPWVLTVGASTTDRSIRTTVKLGNGLEFYGESAYQPAGFPPTLLPLVYPGFLGASDTFCSNTSLDGIDVEGKAVVCDDGNVDWIEKGENVKKAGGAAMIIANYEAEGVTTNALPHVLPASQVAYGDGLSIKSYIKSDPAPTAAIAFDGTIFGTSPAPAVASFSSRGPSQEDPNILKPDIIGPGVNILAAWPFAVGSNKATKFNIISGTSMATPHLSGVAALLKSAHPGWSPAAIKSAIMTTAYLTANDGNPVRDQNTSAADAFATGAGHVDPTKAVSPGLVYDIDPAEYVSYLCGLRYTDRQVSAIVRRPIRCSRVGTISSSDLNYPSFSVTLGRRNRYKVVVSRTVTNVGAADSSYTVRVSAPEGAKVTVDPEKLAFSEASEKAKYSVTFVGRGSSSYAQGSLTWVSSDNSTTVSSPIVVAFE